MIAKYNDNEVHTKCVEYSNNGNNYDKSPVGLSLETSIGRYEWTTSDGIGHLTYPYGMVIRITDRFFGTVSEIFIPDKDWASEADGSGEIFLHAMNAYIRGKKITKSSSPMEFEWTPWRRLAFADEIPKATCPFPIGFSFMLTTAYTDSTISNLKAAYPGTSWGYEQVAGLYNTNVIRRIK